MRADGTTRTPINPGWLRHRVTFQRKVVTGQDTFGQDIYSWQDYLTCKAKVTSIALQGAEFQAAGQRWAEAHLVLEMYYPHGVTIQRADRVYWHETARYLDVVDSEDTEGQRQFLMVYTKQWTA